MRTFKFNEFNGKTKRKRKFKFGILFRMLTSFAVISFLFVSPIFLFNRNIYLAPAESFFNKELKNTVLSLIHVETFEGGKTSRSLFLEKLASRFNKKNTGVYITIKTLTPEQLKINYSENFCDIVSFGFGVGDVVLKDLIELPEIDMREEFLESSKMNNKVFAYPYMYGGYVAITREQSFNNFNYEKDDIKNLGNITIKQKNKKEYSLGFAKNGSINIANSLVANDISTQKELFYENDLSTYEMYESFLGNKFATLIGTTRDLIRCNDRVQKGTISNLVYNYLGGYTDLVQYMGITSKSIEKQEIAKNFLDFVMQSENQKELTKVGLFSCVEKEIYADGILKDFEKFLSNKLEVPFAYLSTKEIEELKIENLKKVCYEV